MSLDNLDDIKPRKRGRVYVVQRPTRRSSGVVAPTMDLTPAEAYGDLFYVLPDHLPNDSLASHVGAVRTKMAHYGDDDYLLLVGYPAFMGVVMYYAAENNRGRVNVLRWNRVKNTYHVMRLDLQA